MTKQELKNGMIVETRDGFKYLYCEGILMATIGWEDINNYNDNLIIKDRDFSYFDIIRVYKDKGAHALQNIFKDYNLSLIWERPETPKLSEREIEMLKALDVIGFTHIARDKGGNIFAYQYEPVKDFEVWLFNGIAHPDEMQSFKLKRDLFTFIGWKDKEPTNILNLLSVLNEGVRK